MKSDIIYLKLEQNSQVSHKKVLLEDVAEILTADQTLQKESGKLVLYTFSQEKEQKLVFSAMKVIAETAPGSAGDQYRRTGFYRRV